MELDTDNLVVAITVAIIASVVTASILLKFVRNKELSRLEIIVMKLDHAAHVAELAANAQVIAMREAAKQREVLMATGKRSEEAARIVASDLASAHERADAAASSEGSDSHGQAADAFSKSPP